MIFWPDYLSNKSSYIIFYALFFSGYPDCTLPEAFFEGWNLVGWFWFKLIYF